MIVMAMAQQKGGQLLTGLTQTADRRKTCAHEIADCLMTRIQGIGSRSERRPALNKIAGLTCDPQFHLTLIILLSAHAIEVGPPRPFSHGITGSP